LKKRILFLERNGIRFFITKGKKLFLIVLKLSCQTVRFFKAIGQSFTNPTEKFIGKQNEKKFLKNALICRH